MKPRVAGHVSVFGAVNVTIVEIRRHRLRPSVLVEYRIGDDAPRRAWLRVKDSLLCNLRVDFQ